MPRVGIRRRAVDHRDAERAEREDGDEQRPVDVVVEAAFEHRLIRSERYGFRLGTIAGFGGSGRPSFFAKNVSSMCCATSAAFAAVDAVLEEHDAGNLRVVARREEHEPAVVAQVLVVLPGRGACPAFEITCAVPGLARRRRSPSTCALAARCRAPLTTIHRPSRIACSLSGSMSTLRLRRRRRHRLPPVAVVHRLEQMRRHARAAVGERRHVDRHRHRRHRRPAPWPIADRDRLAGVPLLVQLLAASTPSTAPGPALSFGRSMPLFTPRPSASPTC